MAERDVFERRLRTALLHHVEGGPTDFDALGFARKVAAKEPRRRGLRAALTWRGLAVPRVAWVLLLLALLTAMVVGTLIVGSQPQRTIPAVLPPVGQVFECPPGSTPDEPGAVGQARPSEEGATVAFDRRAGRLVAVTNAGDGVETWTFDVCTNTWARMHPDREPPGLGSRLVYDVDGEVSIAVDRGTGTVWAYDLAVDTWSEKGAAPNDATFWAYDPVSSLMVAASGIESLRLWNYDVGADTWTPVPQVNGGPGGLAIAYDASVDRLVGYDTNETALFDLRTGTWSRSGAEMPAVVGWLVAPGVVYDEGAERTVVFNRGPWTAYDATVDRWEILADPEPPAWNPSMVVYDPVNRRLVGWSAVAWGPYGGVAACDLVTGEWTVLLEPNDGLPAW
jgi:hypothetical protein